MDLFTEERDSIPPARPNSLVHPSLDEPVPFANSFLSESVLAPLPGDSSSLQLPQHEPLTRGLDSSLLLHNEGLPTSTNPLGSLLAHEQLPLGGSLGGLGSLPSTFGGLQQLQQLPAVGGGGLGLESGLIAGGEGFVQREAGQFGRSLLQQAPLVMQHQQQPLVESFAPMSLQDRGAVLTSDMAGVPPPPPLDSSMEGVPPPPPMPAQGFAPSHYTGQLQTANFDQAIHQDKRVGRSFSDRPSSLPANGGNFATVGDNTTNRGLAAPGDGVAPVSTLHEEKKHESFIDRLKEKKHIHDAERAEEKREKELEKEQKEIVKEKEKEFKEAGMSSDVAKTLAQQQPPLQGPIITNAMPGVPPPPPVVGVAPPEVKTEKKHHGLSKLFHRHKKEDKENVANAP